MVQLNFTCSSDDTDYTTEVTCGADGSWDKDLSLPPNCSASSPSAAPTGGTIEWNNSSSFGTTITYTCPANHFFQVRFCGTIRQASAKTLPTPAQ